jgi:hypothetical protein
MKAGGYDASAGLYPRLFAAHGKQGVNDRAEVPDLTYAFRMTVAFNGTESGIADSWVIAGRRPANLAAGMDRAQPRIS